MVKALFVALLVLTGCASYTDETREIRSLYKADQYKEALDKLDKSSLKEESKNRLLYRMEKAMILDRMGEDDKARKLLVEADKLADELYTTSVSKTAASFVMNDATMDYSGEDYEKVAIHTQMALSYIGTKDYGSARVEASKINNKLYEINQKYGDKKNKYAEDAFARYLSALVYDARGEIDDAIIDYGKAVDLYAGSYSQFVEGGVPDGLVRAYYRALAERRRTDRMSQLEAKYPSQVAEAKRELADSDAGYVVVVHELGHIAVKVAKDFIFPFGKQVIRFSYPIIRQEHHTYYRGAGTGLTDTSTGAFIAGDNVQDMDAIAHWTLEDKRGRMIVKESARLIAKGQITEQAYKNFGPVGGIAANIFSAVTETADTRSWSLLPEAYFITWARFRPGKHTVRIQTGGKTGQVETIDVKKGKTLVLRDVG